MSFGFRKSKSFGGVRLNLSKSGIGASVGVKGLRVGVSSKGKSYVSGGSHGIYFRENLNSSNHSSSNTPNAVDDDKQVDKGCLLAFVGVFCFILGFFFPIFFVVPIIQIIIFIKNNVSEKADMNKVQSFSKSLNDGVNNNDIETLVKVLSEIENTMHTKYYKNKIYEQTYNGIITAILSDNKITEDELKIIDIFRTNLDTTLFEQINNNAIDSVVAEILSDSILSTEEENQLLDILGKLPVTENKKNEVNNVMHDTKEIEKIQKEGLKEITINQNIKNNMKCYFLEKVEVLKLRTQKGEQYFESNGFADFYLFENLVDIVSTGHKLINIKDINFIENRDGILSIVVKNRQTPFYFRIEHSLLVISIFGELKKMS